MEERLNKVAGYATVLADRYLSARLKLAILDGLLDGTIAKRVDNSYGAHAYNALSLTLLLDLVRDLCVLALDENERAPSIVNVWQLMLSQELRDALRDKAARPHHRETVHAENVPPALLTAVQDRFRCEDIQRKQQSFDETYARAAANIKTILKSDIAKSFKTARDKVIAHYEMRGGKAGPVLYDVRETGLTWGSPREFTNLIERTIWDLVLLATWGSYDEGGFEEMHRRYANDFWARVQGIAPANKA